MTFEMSVFVEPHTGHGIIRFVVFWISGGGAANCWLLERRGGDFRSFKSKTPGRLI